jgi:rhamnose utilization protein RhaD (predicted bifunctional aldolase and dehydrogenase)
MNEPLSIIEKQVKQFCARIGTDPLLVQGPGGNVSWKDNDVLWIKASGKWLAKACDEEIFVPVSLSYLQEAISNKNFSCSPSILGDTKLRPSIETMLHALMPQKVIAHLHAVEALAHLVRKNAETRLAELINDSIKWVFVDYYKPGAELAACVSAKLTLIPDAEVIFLKNHGLVIGAPDIRNLERILKKITKLLFTKPFLSEMIPFDFVIKNSPNTFLNDFAFATDPEINRLSTNSYLISRVQNDWALYPDHVVFLGDSAIVIDDTTAEYKLEIIGRNPDFIFVKQQGVLECKAITPAKKAQLRCYYDVLVRQPPTEKLESLRQINIKEILNWEAEIFRQR